MASSAGFAFGAPVGSTNLKLDEMYAAAGLFSGTNEDRIAKMAKLPLEAQPGTLCRYGLQQEFQGAIIQRISGETLDTFLERRIFGPLGMQDTGFGIAPEDRDRIAPRYTLDQDLTLRLAADQSPFPVLAGAPRGRSRDTCSRSLGSIQRRRTMCVSHRCWPMVGCSTTSGFWHRRRSS